MLDDSKIGGFGVVRQLSPHSDRSWIELELNRAGCSCGVVDGKVVLVEVLGRWRSRPRLVGDGKARLELKLVGGAAGRLKPGWG